MSSTEYNLESMVDTIYEEIDEIVDDYYDFILSDGDDGVCAQETFQYTKKFPVHSVRLWETSTSWAEVNIADILLSGPTNRRYGGCECE